MQWVTAVVIPLIIALIAGGATIVGSRRERAPAVKEVRAVADEVVVYAERATRAETKAEQALDEVKECRKSEKEKDKVINELARRIGVQEAISDRRDNSGESGSKV